MNELFNYFQQNRSLTVTSIILVIAAIVFLFSWLKEPRRLINGVFFTIFLLVFAGWLTVLVFSTQIKMLRMIYGGMVLLFFLSVFLLVSFAWLFCLWNAYFVWKYESHTLPNLLTLILGIILILIWVVSLLGPAKYLPRWLNVLLTGAPIIAFYLACIMYNYLLNSLLYQFYPRHYHQDYLIVLGAGLINGKRVTPLLASRINRAIQFYEKQLSKGNKTPKFIMSGGQGNDEKISEARAMADYAIERGIDKKDIFWMNKRNFIT